MSAALSQLTLSRTNRSRLLALRRCCAVWAAWDRFEYAQAFQLARQDPDLRSAHGQTLAILKKTVSLLEEGTAWPKGGFSGLELVEDLLQNADRCAARARYDDAVCRLYRATELLAQIRLASRYGIRASDVDPGHEAIPEEARLRLQGQSTSTKDGKPGPVQVGLAAAYQLLGEMGDPLGAYFSETKPWILNALASRNNSFLAHGLVPIGPETWKSLGAKWRRRLEDAMRTIQQ